jgi:hypothetical protein
MSAPAPDDFSLLAKVLGAAVAIVTPIWGFLKLWTGKADKSDTDKCLKHIEKLYENAEADRKLTRDLHDKAMESVSAGQRQIIEILTRRG